MQSELKEKQVERICMACRQMKPREELLRLTVDSGSGEVLLNVPKKGTHAVHGRSAYLCASAECVKQALKGNRLKAALQGGRGRKTAPRRQVKWPLESSLIHTPTSRCTES